MQTSLKKYRITSKQLDIIEYVFKFETMNKQDMIDNGFSQNVVNRLVEHGILDEQDDEDDYIFYDLSSEFYNVLITVMEK